MGIQVALIQVNLMLYLAKPQILLLILRALSLIQMVSLSRVNIKETNNQITQSIAVNITSFGNAITTFIALRFAVNNIRNLTWIKMISTGRSNYPEILKKI
jgi:hypothetical protein